MITGTFAFRLAFQQDNEFRTSEYGYMRSEAAVRAAPTLNRTRAARGRQPYSHIVEFKGRELVTVEPLEVA